MPRFALLSCLVCLLISAPLGARDSLGVFSNWAAFRDDEPQRCYAIAQPIGRSSTQAYASIASWPGENIRTQLHIHLSREAGDSANAVLRIGTERFNLVANGTNAWAQDARMDAAVVAALRSASRMTVSASDGAGRSFSDRYDLSGVATAIDAAVVGCAS